MVHQSAATRICSLALLVSTFYNLLGWTLLIIFAAPLLFGIILLFLWSSLVNFLAYVFIKLEPGSRLGFFDMVFATDKFYEKPFAANMTFLTVDGLIDLKTVREHFLRSVLNKKVVIDKTDPSQSLGIKDAVDDKASNDRRNAKMKDLYQFYRLRQVPRPFLNFYFWEDLEDVDVSLHIREVRRKVKSETELTDLLNVVMMTPFPVGSALWELLVIPEFCGDKSVIIFRVHHVIADGYSFNRIVDEMIGEKSRYMVKTSKTNWKQKVQLLVKTPGWALGFFFEELFLSNLWNQRKKRVEGALSLTTIPLEKIKLIRRRLDCHFASVGMSLLGGALRRRCLRSGFASSSLPKFIKMMHLLPKPNHPLDKMCNHWHAGCFKIPLKTESAVERVLETEKHFRYHTENHFDSLVELQSPFAGLIPAFVYRIFLRGNYGTSMALTSLPAFHKPAQLCNHNILNMYKICGLQYKQCALTAALLSHNDQVAYTIFANREFLWSHPNDDDGDLSKYIHQELEQLLEELEQEPAQHFDLV